MRSATAASAATSHQKRRGPVDCHAAYVLTRVRSVSGTVVTNTQNRRPVSSSRAMSLCQCAPSGDVAIQSHRNAVFVQAGAERDPEINYEQPQQKR